ncbi:MAG: hypothetical protein M1457_09110, partial [bacterium]|nr:hypothetical protein [bacterium]
MRRKLTVWIVTFLVFALAMGCATPVGVTRAGKKAVYRQLTASVLSVGQPSSFSKQFLERLSLADSYAKNPEDALAELHAGLGGPDEHDRLFALAELSFDHARRAREPRYSLAAAVYAYAFLFPADPAKAPSPYDPRLRLALGLYNRGITDGLRASGGDGIDLRPRRLTLPFGSLDLATNSSGFIYDGCRLADFISVEDYEVRGFRNHYRKPGIGAALSASTEAIDGRATNRWLLPHARVPVTAFVRFDRLRQALSDGHLAATIELYDVDVALAVRIEARTVPLESDPSAALAYSLEDSPLWDCEIAGFRRGDFNLFGKPSEGELYFLSPYRQGRIPVIFVHGTASSPARWAEMVNELL